MKNEWESSSRDLSYALFSTTKKKKEIMSKCSAGTCINGDREKWERKSKMDRQKRKCTGKFIAMGRQILRSLLCCKQTRKPHMNLCTLAWCSTFYRHTFFFLFFTVLFLDNTVHCESLCCNFFLCYQNQNELKHYLLVSKRTMVQVTFKYGSSDFIKMPSGVNVCTS